MSEDLAKELLAKLQLKENRLDVLNEIKTHLSNVAPNDVNVSAKFLSLLDSIDECGNR